LIRQSFRGLLHYIAKSTGTPYQII